MGDKNVLYSDLDEEDIKYLQQSFQTLISEYHSNGLSAERITLSLDKARPLQNQLETLTPNYCPLDSWNWQTISNNNNNTIVELDMKSIVPGQISSEHSFELLRLLKDISDNGLDIEDLKYLKICFKNLQIESNESQWINKLSWINHPPTTVGPDSGCARTKEYSKILKLVSRGVKTTEHSNESSIGSSNFITTPYGKNFKIPKNTISRDARNDQRRLHTAYESITCSSLLKLNNLKFRRKKLRLGKSEIHGLGLFAAEPIPGNDVIIEYVGEIIRPIIADIREKKYRLAGIGSYCFKLDEETIIDATKNGNLNRFINHSCVPNSFAKVLNINNKKKIVIYSKRAIKCDEEITYDYKMPIEYDKIACLCRAPGCKKTIN